MTAAFGRTALLASVLVLEGCFSRLTSRYHPMPRDCAAQPNDGVLTRMSYRQFNIQSGILETLDRADE